MAEEAENKFERLVKKEQPVSDLPEVEVPGSPVTVFDLMRSYVDQDMSNSEIRRLIEQGAVEVNGQKTKKIEESVDLPADGLTMRVGKKQWFRVKGKK